MRRREDSKTPIRKTTSDYTQDEGLSSPFLSLTFRSTDHRRAKLEKPYCHEVVSAYGAVSKEI